ncbi:hypothetical protein P389DRAFT_211805 [Cystobasidium minutum MCA 4210]|uniref:uncharacterized protein n=1 Tax=Cystobasidium minutum MCA 4210 TaxID=1397322 RepID=UPI0034CFE369|eukprot:jgi/Rhomi1/211805/estExt_Genemark1.C_5_t10365
MADPFDSRDFMLHYYLVLYGILYYDYLSTLNKEYRTIWKAKWSIVKVLFLINRYLMLAISIIILIGFRLHWPTERCQSQYIPCQTLLPVIVAAAGSVILLLRTHIIWGQARWVLYVLVPLLIAHIGISTALAATHVEAFAFPNGIGPCMVRAKNAVMDIYCVLPMIFDLTTSGLCFYKSFKMQREAGDFASSLLRNFTKHGTLYAVGAAAANLSNLAFMAITSKQLGLPTVPSNGGMLCTVFSSIFISRLAMSLKDDGTRRSGTDGMIPLSSVQSSGTGSDFKGGRESNLSGATFVNMPSLDKTRRDSDYSISSKKSNVPAYNVPTQPSVGKASMVNHPLRDEEIAVTPEEHVQWAKNDPRLVSVVRVHPAPSGYRAMRASTPSAKTTACVSTAGDSDAAASTFADLSPTVDSRVAVCTAECMPTKVKMISSKAPLEAITEVSPSATLDSNFFDRASRISPFVYDSVPPHTGRSDEVSPTESSWLGEGVRESPADFQHQNAGPASNSVFPATSPMYAQFPLDDKTPSTADIFVTAPTSVASEICSPQTGSARARCALPRVPAPSPASPQSFAAARASARRASWIQDVGAKLQRIEA